MKKHRPLTLELQDNISSLCLPLCLSVFNFTSNHERFKDLLLQSFCLLSLHIITGLLCKRTGVCRLPFIYPRGNTLLFPGLLKKAAKWLDFNWEGRRPWETFPAHPLAKTALTMGLTHSGQGVMAHTSPSLSVDGLGSGSSAKDLGNEREREGCRVGVREEGWEGD